MADPAAPPGTAERAEASTDVVLAEAGQELHAFLREPDEPTRISPRQLGRQQVRDLLAALAAVDAPPPQQPTTPGPDDDRGRGAGWRLAPAATGRRRVGVGPVRPTCRVRARFPAEVL